MTIDLSEIITHLGENRSESFEAVAPPIIQSSNFRFRSIEDMQHKFKHEFDSHVYSRGNNPTVAILRKKLAALEHCEEALVFSSGSGAVATAVISQLKAGDHVLCVSKPYSWTRKLFTELLTRFNVDITFVDGSQLKNFESARKPNTKVVYLESPNSWTCEVQPLQEIGAWAKTHALTTIIDNSYCSPLGQNPADLGIDLIVHSATKYISGHSDVVAGCLMGSDKLIRKIFAKEYMTLGSVISAHDAALLLRGLRTLALRWERSSQSTQIVLSALEKHPKVKKIFYPFHASFPQLALAQKQMKASGGLFTLEFDSEETVKTLCDRSKAFLMGVSWGGYESLMMPALGLQNALGQLPEGLNTRMLRVYIGLEDPEFLIDDLTQALA